MKKYANKPLTKQVKKLLCYFTIFGFIHVLTACQLTSIQPVNSPYSQYYLWLKSLNENELLAEFKKQKNNYASGLNHAALHTVLLYALPESPIYNPYTAKAGLNNIDFYSEDWQFTVSDFAFISMLKEQLNQHIITLNKVVKLKQQADEKQQIHQELLITKQSEIDKLTEQIEQLKKIELNLSN